jgi:hypothetical protein
VYRCCHARLPEIVRCRQPRVCLFHIASRRQPLSPN